MTIQVNVKLDERLLKEVERLVKEGRVKTKKEAFERALQLLVKSYKAGELTRRVDEIRDGTEKFPSVTALAVESHEEES